MLAADFFLPLGVTLGILYVLVVFVSSEARAAHAPLAIAALATVFIVIAWYTSPFVGAREAEIVLTNRLLSIFAVWLAAVLLAFRLRAERQRNSAYESLALSEARAAAMFEAALDPVITMDAQGNVLTFNSAAEKTFGYRREDAVGRQMAELIIPPSLRQRHRQGLARYLATGAGSVVGRRIEMPAMRAGGAEFPVELIVARLPTDGPAIFAGYLRDITDRKVAEETLRKSEERLRNAIAAADVGTWRVDLETGLDTRDASLNRILGLDARDSTQPVEDFFSRIHPDDRPRAGGAWQSLLAGTIDFYDVEVRIVRPGGEERWLRDRGAGIRGADGHVRYVTGAAADITERKRAEEALRETNRRKDEFLATLSHELRNPLAPLRTGLELMRIVSDDPAKVAESRAIMERQVEHLIRLVDDLLDVSRITRGRLQLRRSRIELAAVVRAAVQDTLSTIQYAGHTLDVTLPDYPIVLDADPVRLGQVLTNLLMNATKYTPNGGRIELAAERQEEGVALSVRDNGCGIPSDKLQAVFEMFGRVDRSLETGYKGLGVGLGLVKSLVEMHGGTIEARSDGHGKGSEFHVWLPMAAAPAEATAEASARPPPPEASVRSPLPEPSVRSPLPEPVRQRVLIVDDNRDAAHSLATLVELLGHDVRVAYDGLDALEAAAEFRPQVVLLDIGLPKLNGYDVARRIREQPWGEGVVLAAVTGWGQDHDRREAKEAGFDRHLTKPVQLETVQGLLNAVARDWPPESRGPAGLKTDVRSR